MGLLLGAGVDGEVVADFLEGVGGEEQEAGLLVGLLFEGVLLLVEVGEGVVVEKI